MKLSYLKFEGESCKPFYLPVERDFMRKGVICWIFPLAPFVLLWKLGVAAFREVWRDLIDLLYHYQTNK